MPLPSTMTPIATLTLSSASTSVTFTNIPQGYTDLVLVCGNLGMSAGGSAGRLRFNSDKFRYDVIPALAYRECAKVWTD